MVSHADVMQLVCLQVGMAIAQLSVNVCDCTSTRRAMAIDVRQLMIQTKHVSVPNVKVLYTASTEDCSLTRARQTTE